MNKKEITMTLVKIKAMYPNQFKGIKEAEWRIIAGTWESILKEYQFDVVNAALNAYIAQGHEWAPNPGQVRKIIVTANTPQITSYEAWEDVRRALSNAGRDSIDAFKTLPEPAQKAVGSPETLKQWAVTPLEEIEKFIKPRFIKDFDRMKSDYIEGDMPLSSKNILTGSDVFKQLEEKTAMR